MKLSHLQALISIKNKINKKIRQTRVEDNT